jgi:hypothetical protein
MTKIGMALEDLHEAENTLLLDLQRIGERHAADHEVAHVTRDLTRWSAEHVARLAAVGGRFSLDLDSEPASTNPVVAAVRRTGSELTGRRHDPALLLLDDLRKVYGDASRVQVDWEVVAQAAHAVQDKELVTLAEECRAQTQRQVTWAETKLKETAAQALVTP